MTFVPASEAVAVGRDKGVGQNAWVQVLAL